MNYLKILQKHRNKVIYAGILLFLALYVLINQAFFGFLVFLGLLALILIDFTPKKGDWQTSVKETAIALGFALGAWFLLSFLLNTSSPLNVVTSCSMLPNLYRGDMIILQGGDYTLPEINVNQPISEVKIMLNKTKCLIGSKESLCTTSLLIDGKTFDAKPSSNDVLVFEPTPKKYGLIIHRGMLKINALDGSFYLTKGDNNPVIDQESTFELVKEKEVVGRVLFKIPLLGYVKLLLFMQFDIPPGCDRTISYS
ncbi:MAG: hypothetical protein ABH803_03555 [Candidatus Micrarchaeota archaeon]